MRTKYVATFTAVCALMALSACSCQSSANDHEHSSNHDGQDGDIHQSELEGEHDHHDGEITLHPEQAEILGVETTIIELKAFSPAIRVSGQLLPAQGEETTVSASSSGVISFAASAVMGGNVSAGQSIATISASKMVGGDSNEAAKIAYESAKAEIDRLTPLYESRIVTQSEYTQALRAYEEAKIAYNPSSESGSRVSSPISGVITRMLVTEGEYVEAGTPIATVGRNRRLLLRADLPQRHAASISQLTMATFRTTYSDRMYNTDQLDGSLRSSGGGATSENGYIPVVIEITNDGSLIAGSYCDVYLKGSATGERIVVPNQALTEQQGVFFVYQKIDEEGYLAKPVKVGESDGVYTEIIEGVAVGDEIVTTGAVMVKMAANSGSVPGHTHNH